MEQEFQRADLEALMGGDALLDGQELSCGFVRIAAVGLLMNNRAKRGEDPLFNMNFNSGRPVLPFPFTLEQFNAFCAWHPLFRWEVIEAEFTNDDNTIDSAALAELDGRSLNAGKLVRGILGISPASVVTVNASEGAASYVGQLAAFQPQATTPSPAPVWAVSEFGGDAPWKEQARTRAYEIIKRDGAKDLYPNQVDIADEIAKQFRRDGVNGIGGKPLTGTYIKRHALNGISSEQGKQLSTAISRGK